MGLTPSKTHIGTAQRARGGSQNPGETLTACALHSLLGHFARLLVDIQKVRIAVNNRQKRILRDGLDASWGQIYADTLGLLLAQEKAIRRQLRALSNQHVMADWVTACPGLGLEGFAAIVGVTGSFENFPTVSKVWKYLGLHTENGQAPTKTRGIKLAYSPRGRAVCYQIASSIVRLNRGSYRAAYDRKKTYYEDARPDWSQKRRHLAAMRYAIKALIKDMWIEWHRRLEAK